MCWEAFKGRDERKSGLDPVNSNIHWKYEYELMVHFSLPTDFLAQRDQRAQRQ